MQAYGILYVPIHVWASMSHYDIEFYFPTRNIGRNYWNTETSNMFFFRQHSGSIIIEPNCHTIWILFQLIGFEFWLSYLKANRTCTFYFWRLTYSYLESLERSDLHPLAMGWLTSFHLNICDILRLPPCEKSHEMPYEITMTFPFKCFPLSHEKYVCWLLHAGGYTNWIQLDGIRMGKMSLRQNICRGSLVPPCEKSVEARPLGTLPIQISHEDRHMCWFFNLWIHQSQIRINDSLSRNGTRKCLVRMSMFVGSCPNECGLIMWWDMVGC